MIVLDEVESTVNEPVEPDGPTRRTVRHWAALVALCLMFLFVTTGPVYWVRLHWAPIDGALVDDVWVQATFVTSAALVLAIAAPATRLLWADRLLVTVFGVFMAAVIASSLWSVAAPTTIRLSTMFLLGTAAALVAGAYLRRFDVLVALWVAMHVGIGFSLYAWWQQWPWAFGLFGGSDLTGIYLNKNSLGPVAMMGAATSVVLALAVFRRNFSALVSLLLFGVAAVDAYVLWRSHSYTPILALSISVVVVVAFVLFTPGRAAVLRRVLGGLVVVSAAVGGVVAISARAALNERLGRGTTLSGRRIIWDVVLDYAGDRPLHGWGFRGVWERPEIIESLRIAGTTPVFDAHSGYLEVLVGVGIIGLLSLLAVVAVVLTRVTAAAWASPSLLSAWALGLVAFALSINLTESFIGPNVLPWAVFCVAAGQAVAITQRSAVPPVAVGSEAAVPSVAVAVESYAVDPGDTGDPADTTPTTQLAAVDALIDTPFAGPLDFSFDDGGEPAGEWRFDSIDPLLNAAAARRREREEATPETRFDGSGGIERRSVRAEPGPAPRFDDSDGVRLARRPAPDVRPERRFDRSDEIPRVPWRATPDRRIDDADDADGGRHENPFDTEVDDHRTTPVDAEDRHENPFDDAVDDAGRTPLDAALIVPLDIGLDAGFDGGFDDTFADTFADPDADPDDQRRAER